MKDKDKESLEMKALSEKIAEYKDANNLTYSEIGKATGVNRSHVSRVVKLETLPSISFLLRLADYMNVDLYSLLIPSHKVLKLEYTKIIEERLSDLKWDLPQLQSETDIKLLRLREIIRSNVLASSDEMERINQVLSIDFELYPTRSKVLNIIDYLLQNLGINNGIKGNILDYISENSS